jgi:type IV pilus assembly protein PilW
MSPRHFCTSRGRAGERGFSLIELMIALVVTLVLLGGLVTVFANSSRAHAELKKAAEHTENGTTAIRLITQDINQAGYFGEFYMLPDFTGVLPDPCDTTLAGLYAALAVPIHGFDAQAASPIACLGNNDFVPGTDVLVVRRAETAPLAAADSPVAGDMYIQAISTAAEIQIGAGSSAVGTTKKADNTPADLFKKDGVTAADIRKFDVHIYFIAPCSIPADGGDSCTGAGDDGGTPIPTLKRLELTAVGGAPGWRIVPLAEGIQNFQVDYGVDSLPATQNVITGQLGDGVPDAYVTAPATADWPNVVSVGVNVLARAVQATSGHVDTKTYGMGLAGNVGAFNDAFKRHAFTSVVRSNNVSGRREIPQ